MSKKNVILIRQTIAMMKVCLVCLWQFMHAECEAGLWRPLSRGVVCSERMFSAIIYMSAVKNLLMHVKRANESNGDTWGCVTCLCPSRPSTYSNIHKAFPGVSYPGTACRHHGHWQKEDDGSLCHSRANGVGWVSQGGAASVSGVLV